MCLLDLDIWIEYVAGTIHEWLSSRRGGGGSTGDLKYVGLHIRFCEHRLKLLNENPSLRFADAVRRCFLLSGGATPMLSFRLVSLALV